MVYTCISGIILRSNIGGGVERGQYLATTRMGLRSRLMSDYHKLSHEYIKPQHKNWYQDELIKCCGPTVVGPLSFCAKNAIIVSI